MSRFRRTTLIITFCISIVIGLALARRFYIDPVWALILTPFLLLLRRKSFISLAVIVLVGLGLGLWRGGVYVEKLNVIQSLTGQKITIIATATTDGIYANKSQLEFIAKDIQLAEPENKQLAGKVKVSGFGEPMVYRGDRVQITGKMYPMRGSNQARVAYAQLERISLDTSFINQFTRKFSAGMQNALPEPLASFGAGILIGQRNTMPQEVLAQLTAVGLVHIVAVSGYNLTILVRGVARLKLPSKYQQLVFSLSLVGTFLLITGFSASIVRAAIVSTLSLWAWYYGRKIRPMLIIMFTAALTGMVNPFYVWSDLGWYLSFLAFFGILIIAPILAARLFSRPPKALAMVVIETLSAEIMTLPLIAMIFGKLSLIALVANVLIVPLVPLAMLLAAIAAGSGMLLPQLASWFAWPAKVLLTYILDLVYLLSNIPSVLINVTISPAGMVTFYIFIMLFVLAAYGRVRGKNVIITDINHR